MATFNEITLEDLEYLLIILNDDLQEFNYQKSVQILNVSQKRAC
jgi:hypothetical protein